MDLLLVCLIPAAKRYQLELKSSNNSKATLKMAMLTFLTSEIPWELRQINPYSLLRKRRRG